MTSGRSHSLEVPDMDSAAWFAWADARGWGDGLPTLVPTLAAVDAFIEAAGPVERIDDPIPPSGVIPDIRSLAANALMAGCKPAYFPIVLAALQAVLADEFNAVGVLATTHPCTPLILVSGRSREIGEVDAGGNCMGQGQRGNATISRALNFVLANLGGSRPGTLDRATHGAPTKYTYCFAENEADSPWESYGVRRGFDPGQPVVTVFAAEGPHNVNDHGSTSGGDILHTIAGAMTTPGSNNFYLAGEHVVVLGPEHAATLARDGWAPSSIQQRLFELARIPATMVSAGKQREVFARVGEPTNGWYHLHGGPERIQIVVAGGPGKHSVWIPSFGASRCVSKAVLSGGTTGGHEQ